MRCLPFPLLCASSLPGPRPVLPADSYAKLHVLRSLFPGVPLLALTATATPRLVEDVLRILLTRPADRRRAVLLRSQTNRPNLCYEVHRKSGSDSAACAQVMDWIAQQHAGDCGIVYCYSRNDSDRMAAALQQRGVRAGSYHGSCEDADKERVHQAWQQGRIQVVCATLAFGLGIDKPGEALANSRRSPQRRGQGAGERGRGGAWKG